MSTSYVPSSSHHRELHSFPTRRSSDLDGRALRIAPDLAEALVLHPWPYNVRELFKVAAELRIRGASMPVLELRLVERSEEHTSELQSRRDLVCRLLLEKKKDSGLCVIR